MTMTVPVGDAPILSSTHHDAQNAELGFRFIRALAVEKAALDRDLPRACTFILAAISYFMNSQTKRAWPGYQTIADLTGYSEDVIDKSVRELKRAGYLFTERKSPITGGRALVHYGLGAIHPRDIDQMIAAAVEELRRSGSQNSDPAKKSGVKAKLAPPKTAGSKADPANFSASDPAKFSPQEPYKKEPTIKRTEGTRVASIDIEESHLDEFARLYTIWGNERGIVLSPIDREHTDRQLAGELSIHQQVDPQVLRQAFIASLNTTSAKSHENAGASTKPASVGGSAMLGYFRKCLRSEIGNVQLAAATLTAKARAEQHFQEAQLTQRVQSIGQPRTRNSRGSYGAAFDAAFNSPEE
jgi:hypothetical protein